MRLGDWMAARCRFEFVLGPGEAVFFPPSWVHETENLAPTETCSDGGGDDTGGTGNSHGDTRPLNPSLARNVYQRLFGCGIG